MSITEIILKKRWYYHSLIWAMSVLITFTFLVPENAGVMEGLIDTATTIIPSFILTYLLFGIQDYLFPKKHYIGFVVAAIITSTIMGYFAAYFNSYIYGEGALDTRQWIQNMFIMAFIVIVSRIAKKGIVSQLALKELQVEKLKMEIHLLKAQLNPHFLFNTINNICGVNQVDSARSTEMLIHLAELLRYHLEFSSAQKISIRKEIELIESYIELEKMRLRNNCCVNFEVNKTEIEASIAPLILLPFVENAFKHGTHTSLPCYINIVLFYDQSRLKLTVENSLFKNQEVIKNNIGQKNTMKRLQLIYPNDHELKVKEKEESYLLDLSINL